MKKLLSFLLALVLAFGAPVPSFAAYAKLVPPPGWSQGLGAAGSTVGNTFQFASAATETTLLLGRIGAKAALTVAGQSVAIPVSLKLGAGAVAAAAEWSFGNPLIFAAGLLLPVAYNYYKDQQLEVTQGQWVKKEKTGGVEYQVVGELSWHSTAIVACNVFLSKTEPGQDRVMADSNANNDNCHGHWVSPAGWGPFYVNQDMRKRTLPETITNRPVLLPEFKSIVIFAPPSDATLRSMNEVKYPVEEPFVSPDPGTLSSPAAVPVSRPVWFPTGDPVKNPNPAPTTKPDTWSQPGVKVTASPTLGEPWRVDVVPETKTKEDATTNVEPDAPTPETVQEKESITCGLPGTPACKIDETGTKVDKGTAFDQAKTDIDTAKTDATSAIDSAATLTAPGWTFAFNLPTGCAPYATGLRGFIMNICPYQSTIHDLLSLVWVSATAFALIGMVGRTIRES